MSPDPSAVQEDVSVRLDRIEAKLDQVLAFCALATNAAGPFLGGKGRSWMALLAKSKGGG